MADLVTVDDSSSQIVYSPSSAWGFGGGTQVLNDTTRFTTSQGATATFTFNGTLVQVFGTINMDSISTHHLVSSYSIDGSTPTNYTGQPSASATQFKVQFFKSATLQPGEHTLVISNIVIGTKLDTDLLILDYIQFLPGTTTTSAITSTTSSAGLSATTSTVSQSPEVASPHSVKISTGALIGAVIGAVIPVLFIMAFLIWCLRRRVINLRKRLIETERDQKVMASSPDASDLPGLGSA